MIKKIGLMGLMFYICSTSISFSNEQAKIIEVSVTEDGFVPSEIQAVAGEAVTLNITRKTDITCAKTVIVPQLKLKQALPLNKMVSLKLGVLKKGEIKFGCSMEMMIGAVINVK